MFRLRISEKLSYRFYAMKAIIKFTYIALFKSVISMKDCENGYMGTGRLGLS